MAKLNPGMPAQTVLKPPDNNCYMEVPQSIKYKPPQEDIDKYDLFMATLYGPDDDAREIEACGEARAMIHLRQPPRVRVREGRGASLSSGSRGSLGRKVSQPSYFGKDSQPS